MVPAAAGPFERLRRRYEAAFRAGDAATVAGLYADEAVLMPPDSDVVLGSESIRSYFESLFDRFNASQTISADEASMLGEWAFGRGGFVATLRPKAGGEAAELRGKWVNIFTIQPDGTWKIARHIWNIAAPALATGRP